jgi:polysaccharide deacetylase 2 family uncharacterized protein YibQ
MLHLPMQAVSGSSATGPGEIRIGMSSRGVEASIERALASVPFSAGANNHMGSRATTNPELMKAVMRALAEHHLYFIDSRTTTATVALDVARQAGLPAFYRSVFLDDTRDVDYSLAQLRDFRRIVQERGVALAIGHPYPSTITALAQSLPEFEQDDIELVRASELVRLPEIARLCPPRRPRVSTTP